MEASHFNLNQMEQPRPPKSSPRPLHTQPRTLTWGMRWGARPDHREDRDGALRCTNMTDADRDKTQLVIHTVQGDWWGLPVRGCQFFRLHSSTAGSEPVLCASYSASHNNTGIPTHHIHFWNIEQPHPWSSNAALHMQRTIRESWRMPCQRSRPGSSAAGC
jgi:hypothetical protein